MIEYSSENVGSASFQLKNRDEIEAFKVKQSLLEAQKRQYDAHVKEQEEREQALDAAYTARIASQNARKRRQRMLMEENE